ncbi:MAG: gamma-glutamylcyclotransferase [Nitrospira sp.]|nr:gamma-glutamylcyclotransferase [Nitrospira sp.]
MGLVFRRLSVKKTLCYKYRPGSEAIVPCMKFFLYADQLNPAQLKRRAPEHKFLHLAILADHTIKFCRWSSQWRCGLASVVPSPGEQVWGGVFELTDEDVKIMDEFENDVPQGAYRHVQVTVTDQGGNKELVTTYVAAPIGKFKPKDHYIEWVMKGLAQWNFPGEVLRQWESYKIR